jgi:hypothetical protein
MKHGKESLERVSLTLELPERATAGATNIRYEATSKKLEDWAGRPGTTKVVNGEKVVIPKGIKIQQVVCLVPVQHSPPGKSCSRVDQQPL